MSPHWSPKLKVLSNWFYMSWKDCKRRTFWLQNWESAQHSSTIGGKLHEIPMIFHSKWNPMLGQSWSAWNSATARLFSAQVRAGIDGSIEGNHIQLKSYGSWYTRKKVSLNNGLIWGTHVKHCKASFSEGKQEQIVANQCECELANLQYHASPEKNTNHLGQISPK